MITPADGLSREEAQEIARIATRAKLKQSKWITEEQNERLVLGSYQTEKEYIFELVVTGERPSDALIVSRANVNATTGKVSVEIFLPTKSS